jgi:hypothetical protein
MMRKIVRYLSLNTNKLHTAKFSLFQYVICITHVNVSFNLEDHVLTRTNSEDLF